MRAWFEAEVSRIKAILGFDVPIIIADHDEYKGHEQALGIAHADRETGEVIAITIDEFFVEESFAVAHKDEHRLAWVVEFDNFEEVICHELAHLKYWHHGRWHNRETARLLEKLRSAAPAPAPASEEVQAVPRV